jgi:heat shock protein HslJ
MEKMMKYIAITTFVILLSTILLSACTNSSENLEGTLWRMTSYKNTEGEIIGTLSDVKTTAEFKNGQVNGNAACNTYNGSYNLDGDQITFGMMMTTMMACQTPVMDQESSYLAALALVSSFEVSQESLRMFDTDGNLVLEFDPLEPVALVGTNWLLTAYNNGRGGMQSVMIDTEITANFSEDGVVSGSAGCNSYNGSFQAAEETISIGPIANTEMACMEPDGMMDQETQYLTALHKAAVYTIHDDRLEIRDENGSGVAYFIVNP